MAIIDYVFDDMILIYGINTREVCMADLDMRLAIKIKALPADVFTLLTDIPRIPELFKGFHAVRDYHGGVVRVNDTFTVVTTFMGREILNQYTVTKLTPPTSFAWDSISPQAKTSSQFDIEPTDEGSRIVLHVKGKPRGLVASIGMGMVEETLKEGIIEDLKNIRTILESTS